MVDSGAFDRMSRRSFVARSGGALAGVALLPAAPAGAARAVLRAALQQPGGKITVGTVGDLLNLDPFVMAFVNYPIMETVYDQLVRLDHQITPHPALAESFAVSDDGLTLTLKLRQGVKFQSGREMTAEDVVANIKRAQDKETGGNIYSFLPPISSVAAPDRSTVTITFPEPAAYIVSILGLISVIDPQGFDDLKRTAAGTGAFQLVEWVPGDHARLTKNAAYWDPARPLVDEVEYRFYADDGSLVSALEGGVLDIAISVPPRDAERLRASYAIEKGQDAANFYYLGLNAKQPPFDNKLVRQAMAYALDRATMCQNVLFGVSDPIVTPFPPSSPAYFEEQTTRYPFDLDKAKALLTEAGHADGITFTIPAPSGFPEFGQFAQILQANLAEIGSTVNIEPMDNAQWYPILTEGTYEATFSFAGGSQLYPTRIAGSNNFAPSDNPVWPNGQPPEAYAQALRAADATFDPAKQKEALKRMADAFLDEAWNLPIAFRYTLFGYTKAITGLDWGVYDQIRLDRVEKGS